MKKQEDYYEMREDAIRDRISALTGAEKKGRKNEKIEIAQKMIKDNFDIKMIQKYTELSIEKILELKKSLDKDN